MTRYQYLRKIGCDSLTSGCIAFLNWIARCPEGYVVFMNLILEFDPNEEYE
jgi:hypothetical protein